MLSVHPSLLVDMRKQAIVLCVDRIDSLRNEGKTLEGILDGRTAWEIMDDNFEPTVMSAVPGILVAFQPPVAANDILLALVLCSHQGRYTVGIHSSIYKLLKQGIQRLTCTVTMNEVVTDLPMAKADIIVACATPLNGLVEFPLCILTACRVQVPCCILVQYCPQHRLLKSRELAISLESSLVTSFSFLLMAFLIVLLRIVIALQLIQKALHGRVEGLRDIRAAVAAHLVELLVAGAVMVKPVAKVFLQLIRKTPGMQRSFGRLRWEEVALLVSIRALRIPEVPKQVLEDVLLEGLPTILHLPSRRMAEGQDFVFAGTDGAHRLVRALQFVEGVPLSIMRLDNEKN
mmetsp:Transcript_77038/g.170069  ORF Transcript_77038/g.170069 Transcript_77038/m.170069 type:complete len:346 (-) Transcript_77038:347-1384(-)